VSQDAIIKLAPLITPERWKNPEWERPGRDFYWSGSLALLPKREIPLLVDHDVERQVGVVRELSGLDWVDGRWIAAHVTVTDSPGWLSKDTAASFERYDVHAPPIDAGGKRVGRAFVSEVSVLSPSVMPAEPLARVLWFGEQESPAAASATAAGEVLEPLRAQRIVRHNVGEVIRVR